MKINKDLVIGILAVLLAISITSNVFLSQHSTAESARAAAPQPKVSEGLLPSKIKTGSTYAEAMASDKPAMLVFFADWCGFCRRLAPHIPPAVKKFKKQVNIVMLNNESSENAAIFKEYDVQGFPTVYMVNPKTKAKAQLSNAQFGTDESFFAEIEKQMAAVK